MSNNSFKYNILSREVSWWQGVLAPSVPAHKVQSAPSVSGCPSRDQLNPPQHKYTIRAHRVGTLPSLSSRRILCMYW